MSSRSLRCLLVGLAPIALAACAGIEPATGSPISSAPLVGVDLGASGRVPQIAGLAGEGEGYGRTEPGTTPPEHGPMPGMDQGSVDHGSIGGMGHGSITGMNHDSEMRMAPNPGSMPGTGHTKRDMQMSHAGHTHVQGTGTVNSVDSATRKINISHGPIAMIGWPAMTMEFSVAPAVDLNSVTSGTRIKFDMEKVQDGSYVIQSIAPAGGRQ